MWATSPWMIFGERISLKPGILFLPFVMVLAITSGEDLLWARLGDLSIRPSRVLPAPSVP